MNPAIRPLIATLSLLGLACTAAPPAPRHVVLVVIDTLRRDAVDLARTPVLDSLARAGDRVERAWSPGTWTVPSMVSILSGMPVGAHGWNEPSGPLDRMPAVPPVPLLAEVLRDAGFATTGVNANIRMQELGFERGFDTWDFVPDARIAETLAERLGPEHARERRFVYLHLMGPHSPVRPSPGAAARWGFDAGSETTRGMEIGAAKRDPEGAGRVYRNGYYAMVEDTDARLGELLRLLDPLLDDALLVVTSDHGEMLGEHDRRFAHGSDVWETLTHVPLVVVGGPPLPDALGLAALPDLVTRTLGVAAEWECTLDDPLPLTARREEWFALSPDGRHKTIWFPDGSREAFDLSRDPEERDPLPAPPQADERKRRWEEAHPTRAPAGRTVPVDEETRERLRSLGYTGP